MRDSPWSDDGLEDDVATISYERALRTRAQSIQASGAPTPGKAESEDAGLAIHPGQEKAAVGKTIKTASITIRLSQPECAQLRRRASEAGITVSAYLRSCTLEVEDLRAQVKQALANLRDSASRPGAPLVPLPPTPDLPATPRPRAIRSLFTRPKKWPPFFPWG